MKYINRVIYLLCILTAAGCEKQTMPEALELVKPIVKTDEEYAALRAYKKSDHAISFGWWGASGGVNTSNMSSRYMGLPDSLDIVSMWGGFPTDPEKWAEMRYVQKVKGTRFVQVLFGSGVDNLRKKNFPDLPILEGIDAVAKSIADTINKYELDGFDLDYEPNFGDVSIFGYGPKDEGGDVYTQRLFSALSNYLGPLSNTGKLLIIDGQFEIGVIPYIDYYVNQAYGLNTFTALQNRYMTNTSGLLPTKKFVVTDNMQQYGGFGNTFMLNGVNIGSIAGMALWNPTQGRKGGMGAYILEADFNSDPPFKNIRWAIQIMNPATE